MAWGFAALACAGGVAYVVSQAVAAANMPDDGTDAYGMFMVSAIFMGTVLVLLFSLFLRLALRAEQSSASTPPAGWYPDPGEPTRFRYWEGTNWTERVRAQ